ncbi:trypsin-like serine protease [Micrococcus sp. ACRRV]|uniref:trypsin-like serine protease n=1 Tax=Micrococcus sp. ACRRV TaxID=2918203 RepID=UPI001EF366F9|nr:trypsin-like serine protease [Micrococcus sp. ACRRV]MCG7421754.1 trypsin-like serine protease [Micrococcus sp. ACRRV]
MKKTTLTGATTAALGAVVVAGAGSALAATPLTQGAALSVPAGECSITLVSDTTAFTAAHCGAGQWTVGSAVHAADGARIGSVSALPGSTGVDVVKIALDEDVDVVGDWSTRPAASVKPGETVYTQGSSVPLGSPNSISDPETYDIAETCGDVYTDQVSLDAATTRPGDSGGAVYDAKQRVVGVVSGLAPVSFDEEGRAVGCDAASLSTIMVPAESLKAVAAAPAKATAPAPTVGKHGVTLKAPTAPAAKAPAAEKKAPAAKAPAAEKKAAPAPTLGKHGVSAETATAGTTTLKVAPEDGIDFRTRVQATTKTGGFSYMAVTAYDAAGKQIGHLHLHSDGQPMTWINTPAQVPAGGHIEVQLKDAAGQPTDATVTLGGVPVN